MSEWIKGKPLDNRQYLASFITNYNGTRRTIKAFYAKKFTIESDGEEETYDQYSEDDDCYYLIEGWYEVIENWGDFSSVYVSEGTVTHYQQLPKPPSDDADYDLNYPVFYDDATGE